jgi:hypothetical protein
MRLDQLLPKWIPDPEVPEGECTDTDDLKTFQPSKHITSLTEGFRVFTRAMDDSSEVK